MNAACPYCNATHYSIGHFSGQGPSDGDFSLCIACGQWSIYSKKAAQELRAPTSKETKAIGSDKECVAMKRKWQRAVGPMH